MFWVFPYVRIAHLEGPDTARAGGVRCPWQAQFLYHRLDFNPCTPKAQNFIPNVLPRLNLPALWFWGHLHESTDFASCGFITTPSHRVVVAIATPSVLLTWGSKLSGRKWETDTYWAKRIWRQKWLQTYHPLQLQTSVDDRSAARRERGGNSAY